MNIQVSIKKESTLADIEQITGEGIAAKTLADIVDAIQDLKSTAGEVTIGDIGLDADTVAALAGSGANAKTLADIVDAIRDLKSTAGEVTIGDIGLDADTIAALVGSGAKAKTLADVVDAIQDLKITAGEVPLGDIGLDADTIAALAGSGANAKTLADVVTALASILTQLNTTGLKKIIDPLPAGTNTIGKVGIDSNNNAVQITGNIVAEMKDQVDARNDVITFSQNISAIEIYHNEATPQRFTVNGLTLIVAAGGWRSPIGGIPGKTVGIPKGINCIVARLV